MDIQISDEFKRMILLENTQSYDPSFDPFIFLARSFNKEDFIEQASGKLFQTFLTESFLVPLSKKGNVLGKFNYGDIPFSGNTYFDSDGTYCTGETFEEGEISLEIIVNDRSFPPLDLSYYEPTDRLVKYLNLHKVETQWINPYKNEEIILQEGSSRGFEPHDTFIKIRKSELKDYLAARKCGLLILRYSECQLTTPHNLIGLPKPFIDQITKFGHLSFYIDTATFEKDKNLYFSRLWDSFWIDPASHPRRWDAQREGEFKEGVLFTLDDGEKVSYKQGDEKRYFKILSFNPTVIDGILSKPNHLIRFFCLTNFGIRFPDGNSLDCCVNKEGQIQSFFGPVAKLNRDDQHFLSAFSEPQKAKLSPEYIHTYIEGEFPCTIPWNSTLCECLRAVNEPWISKFGISLLLTPNENDIPIKLRFGPLSDNREELIDLMLEFQKAMIPEGDITQIKTEFDCSSQLAKDADYDEIKTITYIQLLFKQYSARREVGQSQVLKIVNDLRNCKGHPKNVEKVLSKYGLSNQSARRIFFQVMAEFCAFLFVFKGITETLYGTEFSHPPKKIKDPWWQLRIAQRYFSELL